MAKRFSRLKYALKAIQDPTSDTEANRPPAGSILFKYNEFAIGSRDVEYPRDPDSNPGELKTVGVNPFGYPVSAESLVKVPISNRVLTNQTLSASRDAANIQTNTSAVVLDLDGFVPAKATVFIEAATQPTTPETSKITGVRYKKRAGTSFSFPYGSKTGEIHESVVRAGIQVAVVQITRGSVSFKSEKL